MDEIFGRKNFISNSIWQKKYAPSNDANSLSEDHDHILIYAKDNRSWIPNKIKRSDSALKAYKNPDNDLRGPWKSSDYTCDKNSAERPNLYYPVMHPITGEEIWPKKTAVWRYKKETHFDQCKNDLVWWGKNGKNKVPAYKRFLSSIDTSAPHQCRLTTSTTSTTSTIKGVSECPLTARLFPSLSTLVFWWASAS
ncbi:hypothetical protein [Candidatus Sororendozoicomonas aggregata]|uniref:hypothetical protein n=1 Tax=Candidatus Sororendozoicomonas aggregata TaxID=3073239 RepID=UPI003B75C9A1